MATAALRAGLAAATEVAEEAAALVMVRLEPAVGLAEQEMQEEEVARRWISRLPRDAVDRHLGSRAA